MNSINTAEIVGIPVVIPSFEPDEQLVQLCESLTSIGICDICIVDDGSGDNFQPIFETIKNGTVNAQNLSVALGISLRTTKRDLYVLRDMNLIHYVGSDKTGHW